MVPGGGVVSGPGESVALSACESRARQDERTLVRAQFEQPLIGGTRILQSHHIVNFRMCRGTSGETGLFDTLEVIERHGFTRSVKHRRLVHVIPEAGDAI